MVTGARHLSANYGWLEIVEYVNSKEVHIRFITTGYETTTQAIQIREGNVKDLLLSNIHGIGFIGGNRHSAAYKGKSCSIYTRWRGMLSRCYNPVDIGYSRYGGNGVTVCKRWHNYQNYAEDFIAACNEIGVDPYSTKMQWDKDLKGRKGKEYNPDVMTLVTHSVNSIEANARTFYFTNPSGKHIRIYNLTEYCKDKELTRTSMVRVHNGKHRHHKGWTKSSVIQWFRQEERRENKFEQQLALDSLRK